MRDWEGSFTTESRVPMGSTPASYSAFRVIHKNRAKEQGTEISVFIKCGRLYILCSLDLSYNHSVRCIFTGKKRRTNVIISNIFSVSSLKSYVYFSKLFSLSSLSVFLTIFGMVIGQKILSH
jgi:hypothetical protein